MNPQSVIITSLLLLSAVSASERKVNKQKNVKKPEPKKEGNSNAKLPPCAACGNLVASFEKGMARTARGKLEGGDTAWEEKKQGGGYVTSEVRLVEIQEKLCQGVERGEQQCHENHHEWEELLEIWWRLDPANRPGLKQWLCINELKLCCPENAYGPDCTPCSVVGGNGKLCSGNGRCKGAGTRKGNGQCSCDIGYAGDLCDKCSLHYFESYKDQDKLLCTECHKSCEGHCSGSGPKSCVACKPGYRMDTEEGCLDLDECNMVSEQGRPSDPCPVKTFCVNTEGSFTCLECDKACKTCHGDGPDSCMECAEGYTMNKDKFCISNKSAEKMFGVSSTRYLTYFGLCVATAIIFQRSSVIAGILGIVVAGYVTLSEYYLQGATGELRPISTSSINH